MKKLLSTTIAAGILATASFGSCALADVTASTLPKFNHADGAKVTQDNLLEDTRKILDQLSQKERDVLILRYGLDNNGMKKTLDEIGSQYGVSRERIRQIETRALSKLKKLCKEENLQEDLAIYFGA